MQVHRRLEAESQPGPPSPPGRRPVAEPATIVAEGLILDAVSLQALLGTADEIASVLGLGRDELRAAIAELASIGWVVVTRLGDGMLTVELASDAR